MGSIKVPADRYWGAQTQRSLMHFSIGNDKLAQQDDYGVQEYASSFVMEPLGYAFGNLFDNVTATADPASKPGFELRVYPYGGFYAKSMIQSGDPDPYGDHDHHGLNFSLDGHGVVASEIGYRQKETSSTSPEPTTSAKDNESAASTSAEGVKTLLEGDLPSLYRLGIYNSFADYPDASHRRTVHGNYLLYAMVNQSVYSRHRRASA